MSNPRFEALKQFVEASPNDCFVRYGLAQEYIRQGDLDQAIQQFNQIFSIDPSYQAAYYHAGQTYKKLNRVIEARETFQKGIEMAKRSGDMHALSELQAALDELPPE